MMYALIRAIPALPWANWATSQPRCVAGNESRFVLGFWVVLGFKSRSGIALGDIGTEPPCFTSSFLKEKRKWTSESAQETP
jgi:hypothetical protein